MSKINVLGVGISDVSLKQATDIVCGWLEAKKLKRKFYIVTPNPEFLLAAQTDRQFQKILNQADLAIPDGVGLRLSSIKNTTTGTDLMEELIKKSEEKGFTVGLLGGKKDIAEKTKECLENLYPKLKIVFAEAGGEVDFSGNSIKPQFNIPKLDILFVAFGAIKQEKWIYANMEKVSAKIFMGVGGAFDYLSAAVPRAPQVLRSLGLEWLFRLVVQPWRIKRQLSLLRFVYLVLFKNRE